MDYNRNKLYFYPTPEKKPTKNDPGERPTPEDRQVGCFAIIAIAVGVFMLFSGEPGVMFLGLLAAVGGGCWVGYVVTSNNNARTKVEQYNAAARLNAAEADRKARIEADEFNRNRTIVTGAELDKIVHAYINESLEGIALRELGIGNDQEWEMNPICIHDYFHKDIPGADKVRNRQGEDGKHRTSNYNAIMVFFTANQVFCYELRFSLLGANKQDTTAECFYKDIVAIDSTATFVSYPATVEEEQADGTKQQVKTEARIGLKNIKLTTSGGTSISVMLSEEVAGGEGVQKMKEIVRRKKSQA